MRTEKTAPSQDANAPADHWLNGQFFVSVPDMSDETSWVLSKGRAWPAFMAIMRQLRNQERRGKTAEIKADAAGGRLVIGVNALARSAGMTSTAILRQLRFLERQGFIRTHQERFTTETDPATGKITRNASKAPPKVIVMTWADYMNRPSKASRRASRDTAETNATPTGDTPEPNAKDSRNRVRNDRVSKDQNLHRGFDPLDQNGRPSTDTSGEVPVAASTAQSAAAPPADLQPWQIEDMRARRQQRAEEYAAVLGMTVEAVIDLWRNDHKQLRKQLLMAGYDPDTLRRFGAKGTAKAFQEKETSETSRYAIRRDTTASVTLKRSSLRPAEDPAERLQEAVEALPEASKDRADQLGHDLDEQAAAEAQMLAATVSRQLAKQTAAVLAGE